MKSTGCVFDCRHLGSCVNAGVDRSRFHHTLTPTDCTTVRGKFGKAISFNGTTSYVNCGNDTSFLLDTITVETWIYPKGTPGSNANWEIIGKRETTVDYADWSLALGEWSPSNRKLVFGFYDGASWHSFSSIPEAPINSWTHAVATYDPTANSVRIYLNGSLDNSGSDNTPLPKTSNRYVNIGRYASNKAWSYFNGTIDEVRIYNYALSATQIKRNYLARAYLYTEHPVRIP